LFNRAVWFLREFLFEFAKENSNMSECVYNGYQKTLKQYHNFVVRGIFSLALRSVPTKPNFLIGLALDPNDFHQDPSRFERQVSQNL
jgi:pleckstrin family protein A (phosphoinositide binding specific) protein 8